MHLVWLPDATHRPRRLAVGEFDGVHAGHREVIRGAESAFATRVVEMVELEGEIVSSSHIRGLVATGDVATAARLLGAPFELRGTVVHGDKRGRTLGFPTANLVPDPAHAVPDHGIYACRAVVPGRGS